MHYFWEDYRPGDASPNRHLLDVVPDGDYGWPLRVTIFRTDATTWGVQLESNNFRYLGPGSTGNRMQASSVQIGQELFGGPDGGNAPEANWQYNQWRESNGNWHFQNRMQDLFRNNGPVRARWAQFPTDWGSNGGTWLAWCCVE